jgi:hypothetical protein
LCRDGAGKSDAISHHPPVPRFPEELQASASHHRGMGPRYPLAPTSPQKERRSSWRGAPPSTWRGEMQRDGGRPDDATEESCLGPCSSMLELHGCGDEAPTLLARGHWCHRLATPSSATPREETRRHRIQSGQHLRGRLDSARCCCLPCAGDDDDRTSPPLPQRRGGRGGEWPPC